MKLAGFLIIGFFVVLSCIYLYQCNYVYYKEFRAVKRELKKIEGVEILSMGGNDDLTLEEISARLKLSSGDTILLYDLSMNSFRPGSKIIVLQFNQWHFHESGCYWDFDSRLGFPAHYSRDVYSRINTVQDLVKNIDLYKALVDSLPTYPRYDTLENKRGKTFYFQKYHTNQFPDGRGPGDIPCEE